MNVKVLSLYSCLFIYFFINYVESSERKKRELRLPEGSVLGLAVAVASHYPKGPLYDGIVQLIEFEFGYRLPGEPDEKVSKKRIGGPSSHLPITNSNYNKNKNYNNNYNYNYKRERLQRKKRSPKDIRKQRLLFKVEDAVNRVGLNGTACVSRFQCELLHVAEDGSLVEELLVALFKLESFVRDENKCRESEINCPVSLLHIALHSQKK